MYGYMFQPLRGLPQKFNVHKNQNYNKKPVMEGQIISETLALHMHSNHLKKQTKYIEHLVVHLVISACCYKLLKLM